MNKKFSPILSAIRQAGAYILSHTPSGIQTKEGRGNYVTEADLKAEKIILDALDKHVPNHLILSEETHSSLESPETVPHLWTVDPIDGTINYKYQRNYSCVAVSYIQNGDVQLGIIYNPYRSELFIAEKGEGATLNGKPIKVNKVAKVEDTLMGFDNSSNPLRTREIFKTLSELDPTPFFMLTGTMCLALTEVAMGRLDTYYHAAYHEWDLAPGMLLVREAGGVVKDMDGNDAKFTSSSIVAGNEKLVDILLKQLA